MKGEKCPGLHWKGLLQWTQEHEVVHTDWWPDYARLASVSCAVDCGPFSANVGREHQHRTGHAAAEACQ